MNFARIFMGKLGKLCDGRLSCRRSVPPCIGLVKKQSGTLRLRLCVRRHAIFCLVHAELLYRTQKKLA